MNKIESMKVFSLGGNTILVAFTIVQQNDGGNTLFATAVSELDVFTFSPIEKEKVEEILLAAIQWKKGNANALT